jgi:aconitate hydratase
MPTCLVRHLLGAHAIAPPAPGGALAVRADHVWLGEDDGTLAFLAFDTLGLSRVACEEAVVVLEREGGGPDEADDQRWLQSAARRFGARLVRPGAGPAAAVCLRRFAAPGRLVMAGAPGAASAGALGALVFGGGTHEAAVAMAGVPLALDPVRVLEVWLEGEPAPGVEAEAVLGALRERLDTRAAGAALEFGGPGIAALPVRERLALAHRTVEALGARFALFPVDERTRAWLRARGRETDWRRLETGGTGSDERVELRLDRVPPRRLPEREWARLVAGPLADDGAIARIALALRGTRVAPGVRLIVRVGGRAQAAALEAGGALAALEAAGAELGGPTGAADADPQRAALVHGARGEEPGALPADAAEIAFVAGHGRSPRADESLATAVPAADAGAPLDPAELIEPAPDAERAAVTLEPGAHHRPPPRPAPLAGSWRGVVVACVRGRLDAATLLPWGPRLAVLRADGEALAAELLAGRVPGLAARARVHGGGVLVGGRDALAGEPAEAAARALAAAGVRAVIAESFAAGRPRLLAEYGVVPLAWCRAADADPVREGHVIELPGLPDALVPGERLAVRQLTLGLRSDTEHGLDARGLEVLVAGGLLRWAARAAAGAAA